MIELFIKNGQLIKDGTPKEIIRTYISNLDGNKVDYNINRRGDGFEKVKDVQLYDLNNKAKNVFMFSEPFFIEIKIECEKKLNNLSFKFGIKNQLGVIIFYSSSSQMKSKIKWIRDFQNLELD